MKTVLVLAGLIALVQSSVVQPPPHSFKTKQADAVVVDRHRKVLSLFKDISVGQTIGQNSGQNVGQNIGQINMFAEYYETGKQYDVKANIDSYNNVNVVNEFLKLYETGFLPKNYEFSVFHDRLRAEAIALFHLLYYAKDFDTFYKTAAYARVHLNERLFLYAYYIAVIHRSDTRELFLPAPYVANPQLFVNWDTAFKIYRTKMQGGILNPKEAHKHGIVKEGNDYVYYANYSNTLLYNNVEQRLTYFTEDIGLNSYYYYFHTHWPFWWKTGERYESLKDRRGEVYYYFYQQLLARYYFERLTNGLGSIPEFSWYSPVKTGHYPLMSSYYYPFAQRPDNYNVHTEKNYEKVRFLDTYETSFLEFLQEGHFEAFDQKVDFHDPKAINFVGNYWQGNADLYGENFTKIYQRSYDIVARQVLGAAPEPHNDYHFMPSSLDFYQTSLRDPIFYRLYNRIMKYFIEFKQYLEPYTKEKLHFLGVKVTNVEVDKLVTFFDFYQFDASNMTFTTKEDIDTTSKFIVRQPRLNHKDFNFTIDINSDIATDAVFKIFFGPKYDQNGHPINLENNWMNFFEMDVFTHKINPGQNKIVRNSNEFSLFKKDSLPITDLLKLLDEGKVPYLDISEDFVSLPERLMLPRGTYGGFPFQFVVFVYPPKSTTKDLTPFETLIIDNEPLGYPFDRPVEITSFKQPNIFFKDVLVHHEGEYHPYELNVPSIFSRSNEVPK